MTSLTAFFFHPYWKWERGGFTARRRGICFSPASQGQTGSRPNDFWHRLGHQQVGDDVIDSRNISSESKTSRVIWLTLHLVNLWPANTHQSLSPGSYLTSHSLHPHNKKRHFKSCLVGGRDKYGSYVTSEFLYQHKDYFQNKLNPQIIFELG